jgi:hypothetical protein
MRVYVPDMPEFFAWMDREGLSYVVLRNADAFLNDYPPPGSKDDVDMLVEDAATQPIKARYARTPKHLGVKCDVYDVSGSPDGAYQGLPYYPRGLAERLLGERTKFHDRFWVGQPTAYLLGLMYHIAYHKAERSKIDAHDERRSQGSKYVAELRGLMAQARLQAPLTLHGFRQALLAQGAEPAYDQFAAILTNDFSRNVKSPFLAEALHEAAGEVNLFVIREVAKRKGQVEALSDHLRETYTVLAETDIPWLTRFKTRKGMRGGKWKRGGMPVRALVVYDPAPTPTSAEDRKVHPWSSTAASS